MASVADTLDARITALETAVTSLQTAINNVASKQQLKSLANLRQQEIEDLKSRVTTLETQIKVLQNA